MSFSTLLKGAYLILPVLVLSSSDCIIRDPVLIFLPAADVAVIFPNTAIEFFLVLSIFFLVKVFASALLSDTVGRRASARAILRETIDTTFMAMWMSIALLPST
ncbi:hypothetical protein CGLO_07498 [Colletotrichum gloeosporioides Cg-14]|uniref:Uncharacterized protein n=1 Tax=Colletotrichum gloeosporioides (strain Cg-14) TaxID=1237896 RepID=T0KLG7_COLGC|nr:hypothetical protein CGLO_07498 [Colletotrichum gloeosporioides Cg-14]